MLYGWISLLVITRHKPNTHTYVYQISLLCNTAHREYTTYTSVHLKYKRFDGTDTVFSAALTCTIGEDNKVSKLS